MNNKDQEYYYRRAEVELKVAQRSADPKVVAAHYQLAEAYLSKLQTKPVQAPLL